MRIAQPSIISLAPISALVFTLLSLLSAGGQESPTAATAANAVSADAAAGHAGRPAAMGAELPLWSVLPFVALLLAIAILPLAAEHWWHRNRPHPGLGTPENWSSRRGGNWRHPRDVAAADYAGATHCVAA